MDILRAAVHAGRRLAVDRTPLHLLEPAAISGESSGAFSHVTIGHRPRTAMSLTAPAAVDWCAYAWPGSVVSAWCALLDEREAPATVLLQVRNGPQNLSARASLAAAGRWHECRLRLPRDVHGEVSIRFSIEGAGSARPRIALADPSIDRRRPVATTLRAAASGIRMLGLREVFRRAALFARHREDDERYRRWRMSHARTADELRRLREAVSRLDDPPCISVITPVFDTDAVWLTRCIESVRSQIYPRWELCVADDGSSRAETQAVLESYREDPRIRMTRSEINRGIVHASNAALRLASSDFVAFLDHDDEIPPDALAEVALLIASRPDVDVIYTDEDKADPSGIRSQPYFKPDWSPELLRSCMYMTHLTVVRRDVVLQAGGFRPGYEGAQDYDLMLRLAQQTERIAHIPRVLYSWRSTPASAASSQLAKPWAVDAGRLALEDCLRREAVSAEVLRTNAAGHFRVRYAIAGSPVVSILIATEGATRELRGRTVELLVGCVRAIARTTRSRATELVIAHGGPLSDAVRSALGVAPHCLVACPPAHGSPNLAERLNRAARAASGNHFLLLHDDVEPIDEGWLDALLEFSQQDAIGAVGPFLVRPDGRLDHAGIVLGSAGVAAHAFQGEPAATRGHRANALDVRNCAATSGACLLTRRAVFERVGGLDERVGWELYDIDYGLRVRRAGLRVVVTPYARLRHHTSGDGRRGLSSAEVHTLRAIWGSALDDDPYYNPNFDRSRADYRLPPPPANGIQSLEGHGRNLEPPA